MKKPEPSALTGRLRGCHAPRRTVRHAVRKSELLEAELPEEPIHRSAGLRLIIVVVVVEARGLLGASMRMRTEITAGFTLATMSAKPVGCSMFSAATAVPVHAGPLTARNALGPVSRTAKPRPATDAINVTRRAESLLGVCVICLVSEVYRPSLVRSPRQRNFVTE